MGVIVKGAVVKAGYDYVRRTYGDETWDRILGELSSEDRALVETAERNLSFPLSVDGRFLSALVRVEFGGSRAAAETHLRKAGAHQADAMLDGMFSIFARFVSPKQAFSRGGSIITSVYTGAVSSRTELADDGKGGAIHILGLQEDTFVSPWQCGWIERALSRFGGAGARVTERSWLAGLDASPELVYDATWD